MSKIIVSFVLSLNVLFTLAVFYVFLKVGHEPTGLIVAWFSFTTGELWMLSAIKKEKLRKGDGNENYKREPSIQKRTDETQRHKQDYNPPF